MRCLHAELPVPLPPHLPEPATWSNSRGLCEANRVVPVSSHSVTPAFSVRPADTNAVLSPSVARRTAWPTGQAVIAAWIAAVSSVSSLGLPGGHRLGGEHGRARGRESSARRRWRRTAAATTGESVGPCRRPPCRPGRPRPRCRRRRRLRPPPAPCRPLPAVPAVPPWAPPCPPLLPAVPAAAGRNAAAGRLWPVTTLSIQPRPTTPRPMRTRVDRSQPTSLKGVVAAQTTGSRAGVACRLKTPGVVDHLPCPGSSLNETKLIFSGTAAHRGRSRFRPAIATLRDLHYGRIVLDAVVPQSPFETAGRETSLLCMRGACIVSVDGVTPRHRPVRCYLRAARLAGRGDDRLGRPGRNAPPRSTGDYPLQIIRYAEVAKDPKLKFRAGGDSTSRDLNIVIGDNVNAGRHPRRFHPFAAG